MTDRDEQIQITLCNRSPFLSDSGCDRGSVDIRQFDDLPFCSSIDPTPPDVPPEVVDSPLILPVPPSCACVSIQHTIDLKYSEKKKFEASASFAATSDCCEGNYEARFNLQIPCPVANKKNPTIKARVRYGDSRSSGSMSYASADSRSCTVNLKDISLDLQIPCPVVNKRNPVIKATVRYGSNGSTKSMSYASADSKSCTINLKDINLDLRLPCPVANKKNPTIKARVRYGSSGSSESVSYASADSKSCTINLKDINLDLRIPCPVANKKNPTIKARVRYGSSGSSESVSYASADSKSCTVNLKDINLDLRIPCPVAKKDKDIEGHPKIRIRFMKTRTESSCISHSYAEIDQSACEARFNSVEFDLTGIIGGGGAGVVGDGPFSPVYETSGDDEEEEPKIVTSLTNCYYQVGGRTYLMSDYTVPGNTSGFVALRIAANSATPNPSVQIYANLAALQTAQEDQAYVITPLYIMSASVIVLDMRRTPFIQLTEVF